MVGNAKCNTCKHSDWDASKDECDRCVGYSRWERNLKPRAIYIGHRKEIQNGDVKN
jgi:hypothetical protein